MVAWGEGKRGMALPLGLLVAAIVILVGLYVHFNGPVPEEGGPQDNLFQEGVPTSCADCHVTLAADLSSPVFEFNASVHFSEFVTCVDCHGGDPTDRTILGAMSPQKGYIGAPNKTVSSETCGNCHSVPAAQYRSGVHDAAIAEGDEGSASCVDCHGAHLILPASDEESSIYPTAEPGTCGGCHSEELSSYQEGIHWQRIQEGNLEGATCSDCHRAHDILPVKDETSSVHPKNEPRTCAACHSNPAVVTPWYYGIKTDRLQSYQESYHSRALKFGDERVATCSDCHESHAARAATDPESSVYPDNLPETCGKCHATEYSHTIAQGLVHDRETAHDAELRWQKERLTPAQKAYYLGPFDLGYYVPLFFQILIPSVLLFLLAVVALENFRTYQEGRKK
jgi:nitrate/TMAO reductase-like tetraheme cytochrome c subunit